jgi:hypothetical protein
MRKLTFTNNILHKLRIFIIIIMIMINSKLKNLRNVASTLAQSMIEPEITEQLNVD